MAVLEQVRQDRKVSMGERLAREVAASLGLIAPGEKAKAMEKALRLAIACGELPERRLPPVADLAFTLGVTPKRVASAYKILEAEGRLVETIEGWSVSPAAWAGSVCEMAPLRRDLALTPMATASDIFPAEGWLRLHERAVREYGPGAFRVGPTGGVCVAKRAIAGLLGARLGIDIASSNVAIAGSRARALEIALSVTSGFGNEIWVEDPGDPAHRAAVKRLHRRPVPVRVDEDGLVIGDGESAAPVAPTILVSGAGHYPLGIEYSETRRGELRAWAKSARAWVIEDWHGSEAAICGAKRTFGDVGSTVRVGSLDGICFGGIALAWIAAPQRLMPHITAALEEAGETPSVALQCTLASSVETGLLIEHLTRLAAARTARLEALELGVLSGARRFGPVRVDRQGLHAYVALPRGVDEAALLTEFAAAGLGVTGARAMYIKSKPIGGLVLGWCGTPPRRTNSAALVFGDIYNHALAAAGLSAGTVPLGQALRMHSPALRA
ncbi:MAG: transcriptional regulator [Rhodospirillales bacterium]|nr:transcriptional regulator [Rhodospirillales bacterium]